MSWSMLETQLAESNKMKLPLGLEQNVANSSPRNVSVCLLSRASADYLLIGVNQL